MVVGAQVEWEARLVAIAGASGVEVFGFRAIGAGDALYGLRRGDAFGEFNTGPFSSVGYLSNGYGFGASELSLEAFLTAGVELVVALSEGVLTVEKRRFLLWERGVMESHTEVFGPGWRLRRRRWWMKDGPYDRTYVQKGSSAGPS